MDCRHGRRPGGQKCLCRLVTTAPSSGRSGPERHPARPPVSVAKSTIRSGSSSLARVSASPRMSRPSGIGVVNFDCQTLTAVQHIARTEGRAGNRVLRPPGSADAAAPSAARPMISPASASRVRGAAHVLLHQPHSGGRLHIQPAAIEAHALADHGQHRVRRMRPRQAASAAAHGAAQRRAPRRAPIG